MKIKANKKVEQFTPVTVSILCETQGELDVLAGLFDTPLVIQALNRCLKGTLMFPDAEVRQELERAGADAEWCIPRITGHFYEVSSTQRERH